MGALRRAGREIERLLRESTEEGVKTALLGHAFALVGIDGDGETVLSRVLEGSGCYFSFVSREDVLDGVKNVVTEFRGSAVERAEVLWNSVTDTLEVTWDDNGAWYTVKVKCFRPVEGIGELGDAADYTCA